MAGINQVVVGNKKLSTDYQRRRRAVERAFKKMPRGSASRCAYDLRMSPASISAVVLGRRTSVATLTVIESWLKVQELIAEGKQIEADAPAKTELVFEGETYPMKEVKPNAANSPRRPRKSR